MTIFNGISKGLSFNYFQYKLSLINPFDDGMKKNGLQLAETLLPLVSLHPQAAKPISLALSGWNTSMASYQRTSYWNYVRNTVDFIAAYFQMPAALFLHTSLNILENGYELTKGKDRLGNLFKIVGNSLYLSTLIKSANKNCRHLVTISLAFQGISQFVQAYQKAYLSKTTKLSKIDKLDLFIKTLMGCIRLYQAGSHYNFVEKAQTVAKKNFVMMRVAAHDKNDDLTPKGSSQAFQTAVDIEELAVKAGAEDIRIVHSGRKCAKQTAERIAERNPVNRYLAIFKDEIFEDPRLADPKNNPLLKKLKHDNPEARKQFSKLPADEKFDAKPVEDYESEREVYTRMNAAVRQHLDQTDNKTFTVFITHQTSLLSWLRGLVLTNESTEQQISPEARRHHPVTCELYPMGQVNGRISQTKESFRPEFIEIIDENQATP